MRFPPPLLLAALLTLTAGGLAAQPAPNQLFSAAAHASLTLAQIDGDYYFGYNRPGLRAGVEAQLLWRPKTYFTLGFTYVQQGSQASQKEFSQNSNTGLRLRLNTVEVPLLLNYRLGKRTDTGRRENYRLYRSSVLSAGLAYGRLVSYRGERTGSLSNLARRENWLAVEEEFRTSDLYFLVGYEIKLGLRASVWLQHGRSLLGLYRPAVFDKEGVISLFPYYLSLGAKYNVN